MAHFNIQMADCSLHKKNILILGSRQDAHAAHIQRQLSAAGVPTYYLETKYFPTQVRLCWSPETGEGYLTLPQGDRLSFNSIQSVYWRSFSNPQIPELPEAQDQHLAFNDAISALRTVMQGTSVKWINSWQAYQFHKEKPLQLRQVKRLGVAIPKTLIGNDAISIQEFAREHKSTIFKPVYGGAHARPLESQHLLTQRLELALRLSPITVQEYVPGTNLRVYVIGEALYAAEIRSDATDFRADQGAEIIPCTLPESVQQQCYQIAVALGLSWTAIDWRLTPQGKYVFLEANPSPMFLHFERQTGYPLSQSLVTLLTQS